MILTELPPNTILLRAHTPRWSAYPTSGKGAAVYGGHFNREGVEALYLSLEPATALGEYQQASPFLPPCTLCSYRVHLSQMVDLYQLDRTGNWHELWHDWRDDWRVSRYELHIEPPTWVLSDMVLAKGYTGITFPSIVMPGGTNIVIYPEMMREEDWIEVIDPDGALPGNQDSWSC